jgi:hypothetical protein
MKKPRSKGKAPKTYYRNAYWKAYLAICDRATESSNWINHNLPDVEFPPLALYLNNDTKVWVSNDTMLGLRFMDWEYRFSSNPPDEATRLGEVSELSKMSIAILHDHMIEHWNNPASIQIRAAKESIRSLMENPASAGEHPTVKAITAMVENIQ